MIILERAQYPTQRWSVDPSCRQNLMKKLLKLAELYDKTNMYQNYSTNYLSTLITYIWQHEIRIKIVCRRLEKTKICVLS